jgi:Ser/Thr protein kinase RdoA (MazF antagonist)
VLRAAAGRVLGALQALGEERSVFGVVHSDPTPNNLIFEGGEARLIDFASCGWGHYLHDVAVALSALEAYGKRRAVLRAAFVEGYRSERPLSEGHMEHLGAFRAMRLARRAARALDRGTPAAREWDSERFSGAMKRIAAYVAGDGSLERMDLGSHQRCETPMQ